MCIRFFFFQETISLNLIDPLSVSTRDNCNLQLSIPPLFPLDRPLASDFPGCSTLAVDL